MSRMDTEIPRLSLDELPHQESENKETSLISRFFPSLTLLQSLQRQLQVLANTAMKSLPRNDSLDYLQSRSATLLNLLSLRMYISATRPFVNFNRLLNSQAYQYPIRHPELWSSLQVVPPHFLLSWMVYCIVWSTFFPLQFVIATIFGGPMGFIIAVIATLQQCHYYSSFVTNKILLPDQLNLVFDGTMIATDNYHVVLNGKLRRISPVPFVTKFRRFMWSIPTEFVFYPLEMARILIPTVYNSVPILGPLILSMSSASAVGIGYQKRYFALKNLKPEQIAMLNKKRMGHYASFGFVAGVLEATPILGFMFEITNTIGAALWCADLEQEMAGKGYGTDRTDTIRGLIDVLV